MVINSVQGPDLTLPMGNSNVGVPPLCYIDTARSRNEKKTVQSTDKLGILPTPKSTGSGPPQRVRRTQTSRPEPLDLSRLATTSKEPTPSSAYLPSRNLGSTGRRAQRNKYGHQEEPSLDMAAMEHGNYRAPYVEDSTSSRRTGESSASLPQSSARDVVDDGAKTSKDTLGSYSFHSVDGNVNERPFPSRHSRNEKSSAEGQFSSRSRDNSSDSAGTTHSAKKSNASSASKTVRFNSSAEIRTPRSPSSSGGSSSENRKTRTKPGDDAQPTRAGIYGDSPPKMGDGRPVSWFSDM